MNKNNSPLDFDILKRPLITDKTSQLLETNEYVFLVDKRATKTVIKDTLQLLFQVTISSVRTSNQPIKKRRVGAKIGTRSTYKKAFVKLAAGESINLFPES